MEPSKLKRPSMFAPASASMPTGSYSGGSSCDTHTAMCVSELMNAATAFHKLHLLSLIHI